MSASVVDMSNLWKFVEYDEPRVCRCSTGMSPERH